MQSFLAKCAALGIVAGGFAITGDMGRLADRGRRLLDARTVPSETPSEPTTIEGLDPVAPPNGAPRAAPDPTVASRSPAPAAPAAPPAAPAPTKALSSVPLLDAPIGRAVTVPVPPTNGPDSIDLRQMNAGSRLLVWIRRPGSTGRGKSIDLIALDLIDPSTGEALEHRHAAMTHGSDGTTVHAAPRRVVVTRDASGRIAKGTMLRIAPLHGVIGLGREESLGAVVAVDVQMQSR